jgi:desulfoferrodoxin (superoxide reductase-like protein)
MQMAAMADCAEMADVTRKEFECDDTNPVLFIATKSKRLNVKKVPNIHSRWLVEQEDEHVTNYLKT